MRRVMLFSILRRSLNSTKHKEDEAQSKMLIVELNHRVKNTLSTVQSIVWQTLRAASDPRVIRESIESRLFALSRSHDLLTRENWHSAGLRDVINDVMEPFGVADGRAERIVITGENICFPLQCREVRCVFQWKGINPDRVDDGAGAG
jgi:two-component sensor histidine kinase